MVLHTMANTADILLPLAPDEIVSDGVIIESAVATVTVTQLAVQLFVVLLVVAYFGHRTLSHREIPGVAYLRGESRPESTVQRDTHRIRNSFADSRADYANLICRRNPAGGC